MILWVVIWNDNMVNSYWDIIYQVPTVPLSSLHVRKLFEKWCWTTLVHLYYRLILDQREKTIVEAGCRIGFCVNFRRVYFVSVSYKISHYNSIILLFTLHFKLHKYIKFCIQQSVDKKNHHLYIIISKTRQLYNINFFLYFLFGHCCF